MTRKTPKLPEYHKPTSRRERPEREKPVYGPDISSSGLIGQVRRAYRDQPCNSEVSVNGTEHLKFASYWYKPGEDSVGIALSFMSPYNRFDASDAYDALQRLPDGARVALGREGSPVIYVAVRACDVREALDAFVSMNVNDKQNTRFVPTGPDELGVTLDASVYPTQYDLPDGLEPGKHFWADDRDHYGKIGRRVTLPNGEMVNAFYEDLHDKEKTTDTALIRAWWD